ncbi:hypothetical protein EJ02DRAFT_420890 [Clathrospora elynae]|uniref:Uncharacterized protein n=1 Tax=Clathrospora elynae TaxID=706981 RepID=A0A6A5SUJ7_9PLEO|nr:hypothetical protein EJ02DRAFT_420890 [Clathrospora elynae]
MEENEATGTLAIDDVGFDSPAGTAEAADERIKATARVLENMLMDEWSKSCILRHGDEFALDLPLRNAALQNVHPTLTDLRVGYELYENGEQGLREQGLRAQDAFNVTAGSLGPLHDFLVLTSLETSLAVLFSKDQIDLGQTPKLADYLPPKLEHLTIGDNLCMSGDFQQCFEDLAAMKIFAST